MKQFMIQFFSALMEFWRALLAPEFRLIKPREKTIQKVKPVPIKKRLSSISNSILHTAELHAQKIEQQKIIQMNQPLNRNYYLNAILYFLLSSSTEKTGINFKKRLQKKYDAAIQEYNLQQSSLQQPLFYSRNPSFDMEMRNPNWFLLAPILDNNFLDWASYTDSIYALIITYTLYGEETTSISNKLNDIYHLFNWFLKQNNSPLRCYDIRENQGKLQFLLGEHQRFYFAPEPPDNEIDGKDNDYGD